MKRVLYTLEPPQGRCLLLAHKLHLATSLPGPDCLRIAEGLFANQHPHADPVAIEIPESEALEDLEATCAEFGITVERAEMSEGIARGA